MCAIFKYKLFMNSYQSLIKLITEIQQCHEFLFFPQSNVEKIQEFGFNLTLT